MEQPIENRERIHSFGSASTPSTLTYTLQQPQQQPQPEQNPGGASDFIGGSGVSLDGRSLILPADRGDGDDISSINTDFASRQMRAMGQLDPEAAPSPISKSSSPGRNGYIDEKYNQYAYPSKPAAPRTKKSRNIPETDQEDEGCLPVWITNAPFWLKMIIVVSTALLVGAMVLVGIGASLAVQNKQDQLNVETPTPAPVVLWPTSTTAPDEPTTMGPVGPTITSAPTASPNVQKNPFKPNNTTFSFFVAGGRFTGDALEALPSQLKSMPELSGDAVLFHLGDWNSPFSTSCVEQSYQDNVELYHNSNLPVYFVMGDNEFNDCPNPNQAYKFWQEYLTDFESSNWPEPTLWTVSRQNKYPENFAFIHKRVLVVGINLVGGVLHDNKEWEQRHNANLDWIDMNYYQYEGQFDTLVLMAHADPEIQANEKFFKTFYELVEFDYKDTQIVFIHRNLGNDTWGLEPSYRGIENLFVVVVEGSIWPSMLVSIDTSAGILEIDQEGWYQEYASAVGVAGAN